jgi:hypothetical protein
MRTPKPAAFYRVWESLGWTDAKHHRFHQSLFAANADADRVILLIADAVAESAAEESDKREVLDCLAEDWRDARVLAAMASSATCDPQYDTIQSAVIARVEELGLTAYEIAKRAGGKVSEDHVKDYLTRRKSMGSHKLQHVLAVLRLEIKTR